MCLNIIWRVQTHKYTSENLLCKSFIPPKIHQRAEFSHYITEITEPEILPRFFRLPSLTFDVKIRSICERLVDSRTMNGRASLTI